MKKQYVICIFFFCILLVQISCTCDCSPFEYSMNLKLTKDDHNALFGPDASINRDSIRFFRLDPPYMGYDEHIYFKDSTIVLDLMNEYVYILKIENTRMDTFTVTAMVTNTRHCGCCGCPYQLTNLKLNGQTICQEEGCRDIIEIQL